MTIREPLHNGHSRQCIFIQWKDSVNRTVVLIRTTGTSQDKPEFACMSYYLIDCFNISKVAYYDNLYVTNTQGLHVVINR